MGWKEFNWFGVVISILALVLMVWSRGSSIALKLFLGVAGLCVGTLLARSWYGLKHEREYVG